MTEPVSISTFAVTACATESAFLRVFLGPLGTGFSRWLLNLTAPTAQSAIRISRIVNFMATLAGVAPLTIPEFPRDAPSADSSDLSCCRFQA